MKVLLVQPPQGARFGVSQALLIEPLGLEMVGAALQAGGHDVSLIDLRLDRVGRLDAALDSLQPPAAGISCGLTTDVYTALITARRIKERRPGTFVFCGGHHASVIPGDLLFPGSPLDAVVIGEGEGAAAALIDTLDREDDPGQVPGVMTGESRHDGFRPRPPIGNLDELPLPARELTQRYRRRYHHGFSAFSAAVEMSRGCFFDGSGCKVRHRSPKRVVEDLKRVQALGGRNVLITDEIAFLDHDIYQRLGRRLGRAGLELAYAFETRADLVVGNRDLLELWKGIGATTVRLGDGDRSQEAIEVIRSARIEPMTALSADPDWGDDEFASLERVLDDSRLPNPAFTILTPLPGTELWEEKKGQVTTGDYSFFDGFHLVLPARLGAERFYERFARLCTRTEVRTQITGMALLNMLGMTTRSRGRVVRKVFGAVTEMRSPEAYLVYPGTARRPEFVPEEHGTIRKHTAGQVGRIVMKRRTGQRRTWLMLAMCLALLVSLGSGVVEAKKNKGGKKCEGTKKQRKQKMEKREISDEQFIGMVADLGQTITAELDLMRDTLVSRVSRKYEAHKATGAPFVVDFLVVSGGGAKGAFGAGFFEGWGKIESGPFQRPEFDVVTGVSTGALLGPFAYLGTDEAYTSAVDFYANPEPNWVKKRGMIKFLPSHISMFNNCHLQDTIREVIDESLLEALATAADEDRMLLIGTTNLDVGAGRVFNLGEEAKRALEVGPIDRVAQILIASASIPGAFPPVEIDGMLYADGGATSNLFLANFPGPDGAAARFKRLYPEAPFPKVRIWVIVNQQLKPQHALTEPKWISVSARALGTLTSTSQLFALALLREIVDEARDKRGMEAELHIISIPNSAPAKTTEGMFDQEYMRALQDLGRRMGAGPLSWTDEIPSAYKVQGEWPALE